jgi:acyl-CoA thioester hydrolase
MGYLYHGNYAQFYEIGRVEMIRSIGLPYKDLEDKIGVGMPVMTMETRYVRPAYFDDVLTVKTTVKKMPVDFLRFNVEIFNQHGKLVCGGKIKLCFMDMKTQKRVKCPQELIDKMKPHFI